MDQPSLFDGPTLKALGINTAARAAEPWTEQAHAAIAKLASRPEPFTSEDVINMVGLPNPDAVGMNRNNAVGAVMSAAARAGLIHKTGAYVESRRPSSHAAVLAVWTGT